MDAAHELAQRLSNPERRVLAALAGAREAPLETLAQSAGFANEAEAMNAASWLRAKGVVEIDERSTPLVSLGPEGERYRQHGLPERRLHAFVASVGGRATLSRARSEGGLTPGEVQIALAWWKRKGLGRLERKGDDTDLVANAAPPATPDEQALGALDASRPVPETGVEAEGLRVLRQRPGVLHFGARKERRVRLTATGAEVAALGLHVEEEFSQLTPEIIQSGAWRTKTVRPYDVHTPAPRPQVGKPHPLVQLVEEIRDIFLELGFQEIEDEYVVPALWNMDALFIPQDHPAREMQDTLYLAHPARLPVDAKYTRLFGKVHTTGGGTGSRGWGGGFDPRESERALLRTHTTVGTIRYLAEHPKGAHRVFSIGRVFRNEAMDATHLPEFHQIEGIATEPGADFRMLLGILQEFYRRIGFEKLRWRPSYYPYTEPSMDVEVWNGTKWLELGGCGIFRPEVTQPLGVETPVLAWGLGLERLAMMRFGLGDIRQLYVSDLEWLKRQPLL